MPIYYSKTKIYKIIDLTGDLPPYFGSTCQSLSVRMGGHRSKSNKCSSKQIIEKGKNNYKCVLVENYSCKNKEEQIKRESWFIENNHCINKKNNNDNKVNYKCGICDYETNRKSSYLKHINKKKKPCIKKKDNLLCIKKENEILKQIILLKKENEILKLKSREYEIERKILIKTNSELVKLLSEKNNRM